MRGVIRVFLILLCARGAFAQNEWVTDVTAAVSGQDHIESFAYAAYVDQYGNDAWGFVYGSHCLDYETQWSSACDDFNEYHHTYSGYFNWWAQPGACHPTNLYAYYMNTFGYEPSQDEKSASACIPTIPTPPQCHLSVSASGGGSLSPNPSGTYDCGTTFTLTATPAFGYHFVSWDGDICSDSPTISFILNSDMFLVVIFDPDPPPPPPPPIDDCIDQACSPIVINLARGGYTLTGAESPVLFDIAATGHPLKIGWTAAGADEAFLCLDRNHNGVIDSGAELFGNATVMKNGQRAPNGFVALAELDDNHDGVIDARDAIWSQLLLWRDLTHDGLSQSYEIIPVRESRLRAISVSAHWTGRGDQSGNMFRYESLAWIGDGGGEATPRPVYDIFFVRVP